MLATLGDVFVAIFQQLVDVTVWLSDLVARPVRFLFSPHYRVAMRQKWRLQPVRGPFEFVAGSVVLILFLAIVSFWAVLLTVSVMDSTPSERKEPKSLKERVIEKVRRHRKEKPKASNQTMERTPTRRAFAFPIATTFSLRSTLALGGRRSSSSR